MILDDFFDRIVVLSLPSATDRAARTMDELRRKGLSETAAVVAAVDGKLCPPSDWWVAGAGAWGCMQSHYRTVQGALMDGVEKLLILEDDCIWQNSAAALAAEFLEAVPGDWGQIYFGGQHRTNRRPEWLKGHPAVILPKSVHRTHAYAIQAKVMPQFLKHILYAPDYIEAAKAAKDPQKRHIDHQIEQAHRRGDWKVYAPSFWLAGQGENHSSINGRTWPDAWWHWSWREAHRRLPVIVVDRELTPAEAKWLHFGKHVLADQPMIDEGVRDCPSLTELIGIFEKIAHEAYGGQRLPAIHGSLEEKVKWLREKWTGPVMAVSEGLDLAAMCDYPASKLTPHDWLNPSRPSRVEVAEPSESTDATEKAERRPCVHQVWIGPNEIPPRLEAYCETVKAAFPGWDYKLWREEDMATLAQGSVMPEVVRGAGDWNIGLRADVIRLELLRQFGGVYLDTDFEALRPDVTPLFGDLRGFWYGDQQSGSPANGMMGCDAPRNPFVEMFLQRVAGGLKPMKQVWDVVKLSGPTRLAECLNFWVGDWSQGRTVEVGGQGVATTHAGGSITGFWRETVYPYHYDEGTWASFKPEDFPKAWLVHHWEGGWHRA